MRRSPSPTTDSAEVIEFGIPVVEAHLSESTVTFPATPDDITAELGDLSIPYDASGNTVALSTVLSDVDQRQFDSKNELLETLHEEFEARRTTGPSGLVATVQEYLPI